MKSDSAYLQLKDIILKGNEHEDKKSPACDIMLFVQN